MVSTWTGTNDTPTSGYWSPTNPAGMTQITQNVYDNGGVGDGNLTQTTLYPGGSQAPRITQLYYNWQDEQVASKAGIILNTDGTEDLTDETDGTNRPIEFTVYDNLGEPTEQETYTGDGVAVTTTDGVVNAPSADLLRAKSTNSYDDQGNVYQSSVYSVNPTNGDVGDAITTNTFRDLRGDVIATYTPGLPTQKAAFDGAGRDVMDYTTDGGAVNNGGTPLMDYADAARVTNDVVLSQIQNVLDGDGDEIETIESDRLPEDSTTAEGALGNASGTGGPAARVSYAASWFDAVGDDIADETVGTNGGTAWSRPSTPDASDATHLVNTTTYGPQGLASLTIDPRGVKDLTVYNMLGQTIETIAAYTGTSSADMDANADVTDAAPTSDTNQTTDLTLDGIGDETSQTAVMPSGTPSQTTAWVFGVSTSTGSTIDSNDLLAQEEFPDATTGDASTSPSDDVTYTDDNLGEALTMTDQNGTTHGYGYDLLGRPVSDTVTILGSGVDGSVLMRTTNYNQQGGVYQMTAYADTGGLTLVNQVQDGYNGLGQLTGQYEAVSGAVNTSTTPETQYAYSDPDSGSIMTAMTYPNGRVLDYATSGNALDAAIGRVDSVADDSASGLPLATYTYMGLSTIVQQLDGNNVGLSYLQQAGDTSAITSGSQYAGDQVTGLGRFGQVIDQNWVLNPTPASTPTPTPTPAPVSTDRGQLGYDQAGDVLYSNNLLNPGESELYHSSSTASGDDATAYDPLQRLTNFERGTLSASGNNPSTGSRVSIPSPAPAKRRASTSTPSATRTSVTTNGTPVDNSTNAKNELTQRGTATLGYDNNGDTVTDQNGDKLTYDAWGDLATDINPTTNHQTTYTTDALGNRVAEQDGARTDEGPVLIVNNGSAQRSMVDSLTVVFPSAVTLASGAITLYNTTSSYAETTAYSNPSGDGKTWLVTFSGSDIVGGSLPNAVFGLTVHAADVSGITLGSDVVWAFHRLFGDINGDGTVDSTDLAAFTLAFAGYDPAFDANANGVMDNFDLGDIRRDLGTTYTYTPGPGPFLSGPSTTAPLGQTDISPWDGGTNDMYYSGPNVIEERNSSLSTPATGAWRQEVWGLGYVNSLIEQDTATAVDSGGILPTSHFLQYSLDTSFNGTGTLLGGAGSYDSVAIQPADGKIVVAGISGSNLEVIRYNTNGSVDTSFGTSGTVTLSETSPTFAKLTIDASGNIDVAVNTGSNVEVYQLSDTGATNWSTALTFATSVVPQGIALESGGDILVAGDSSGGTGIYLAALTSAGALDTGFGSSGYVNAPLSGAPSGMSLALDATGKILVAGSDGGDFSVVRFSSTGSLDTSFNSTGEATVSLGGTDTAYAVSPGPGGTVVAAGVSVQSGNNDDALIRLAPAGALDTTFNSTGKIVGSSGSGTIRAIVVQTNGEVLAGGDASSGTAQKVWMFTPTGAADTAFASGGTLTANSGATVFGWAVASGPTQRIVVAGSYGGDVALAAFAPASVRLYAQQNANYNVTAMVDSNGNVVQRYVYDPYGNMTVLSATWTPQSDLFDTQVGFQGMWLDAASGLYHTVNRDYSTELGRWMEQDPAGYVNGSNLYQAFGGGPMEPRSIRP